MVILLVLLFVLSPVTLGVLLFVWARWLRRRTGAPRFAAWAAYVLLAMVVATTLLGAAATASDSLSAIPTDSVDASQKARLLAEGISEAMNYGALVVLTEVPIVLWLLFATWRWHWAVKPLVPKGAPPYR